jgi:prefoldin subunit 5
MSKERLTSTKGLIDLYAMRVRFTTNEKRIKELLVEFGNEFAAQEVEAAIAETKKQKDELLAACIKMTEILNHGNYELLIPEYEVMMTAITKAEEK